MTSIRRYLTRMSRGALRVFAIIALGMVSLVCAAVLYSFLTFNPEAEQSQLQVMTSEQKQALCGWAGEEIAKSEGRRLAARFVPFLISRADGGQWVTEDRRSVLWDAAIKVLGHHIPTKKQLVGDCVSFGAAHACEYLLAVQIATGSDQEWHEIFPPWIYAGSRVVIGQGRIGCRSDGSVGAWAAAWLLESGGGALQADAPGVPAYSGSLARDWGCHGPPKQFADLAKPNFLKSAAQVSSWQEVRDALINGYPVTIASNVGFEGRAYEKGGKLFRDPRGSWGHQMVIIGYDLQPEPCFFILNSWGPDWCEKPIDGAPLGGFWVRASAVQRIVSQQDSFAFSDASGFPAREWDVIMSGPAREESRDDSLDRIIVHPRSVAKRDRVAGDYAISP
jgi:hypothetical protein